jgi:hypothetical protein
MDGTAIDEAQKIFFQIPDTMLKCAGLIETNEEEYYSCIVHVFQHGCLFIYMNYT